MVDSIKKTSCVVFTIILTALLVGYFGHLLDPDYTEGALSSIKAFHSIEDNSLEVLIYGSSHALKGCNTMEMYSKYGIGAYNYGENWQKINTTLLFIQDSLRTQNPKVVCIEMRLVGDVLEDANLEGQIYYTRAMSDFPGKREYLKQCFGSDIGRYISYYLPLTMFHEMWTEIDKENYSKIDKERWIKSMGYSGTDNCTPISIGDYKIFPQNELPEKSVETLDRIINICEERGIKVILYLCPYEGSFEYSEALKKYAFRNKCEYLDLFEKIKEVGIDGATDYQDKGHLNNKGALKVADYLGEFIISHYVVTDMRKVDGNIWEKYQ